MINEARLEEATALVLAPHLGVAAEFIAEDAITLLRSAKPNQNLNDQAKERVFFIGLGGLLEKTLPFEKIRVQILKAYLDSR